MALHCRAGAAARHLGVGDRRKDANARAVRRAVGAVQPDAAAQQHAAGGRRRALLEQDRAAEGAATGGGQWRAPADGAGAGCGHHHAGHERGHPRTRGYRRHFAYRQPQHGRAGR
eukprot:ctg_1160.g514